MTDAKELESLGSKMEDHDAIVKLLRLDGYIHAVQIFGAKGIGSHPMSPLSAAERMREWLFNANSRVEG